MYLIPIHVPIFRQGSRLGVGSAWRRGLLLLRDSLGGRFGELVVLAPSHPAEASIDGQTVDALGPEDGVRLVPSFDPRCRAREYWLHRRRTWLRDVREWTERAQVVHCALDDLYRPIAFEGVREAFRRRRPAVFVQDTDIVLRVGEISAGAPLRDRLRGLAYGRAFEALCRWSVARADLSLLKGRALMDRYAASARNPKEFHDTSHLAREIVPRDRLEARLSRLRPGGRLQLVYCGRFVERKGLALSLRLLERAIAGGADLALDLVGDGPQRRELEAAAATPTLAGRVRFRGAMPYGPRLLDELSRHDALLFTPTLEDTPRMIFDAYAAGLPLVATDIGYVKERARDDRATLLLDRHDEEGAAARLIALARDPRCLADLARAAADAAVYHAADSWYRRRAEWTFEAVERHAADAAGGRALAP